MNTWTPPKIVAQLLPPLLLLSLPMIVHCTAIYPEDSEVLGHCKGEPVYARENVHMVRGREGE